MKTATGIPGLDEMLHGGIPRGRATLLVGGAGSGKTVLALQSLQHGAANCSEPGIFISFEEGADRLTANSAAFGWNVAKHRKQNRLFFVDAHPGADTIQSGTFDLIGMLAGLADRARHMRAKRIAFDSLDIVLSMLRDDAARRQELYRLHEWLLREGLTGLITAKAAVHDRPGQAVSEWMQFMVDCAITLNHSIVEGVSQRTVRIVKFRGSSFEENERPFLIGNSGFEMARRCEPESRVVATNERVSTGVQRLDSMLSGGYLRGASILVTGAPGTAKSTLAGAFAEAACQRNERTLFVSFDSEPEEIIRNLRSVNLRLGLQQKRGLLRLESAHSGDGSAEAHYLKIRSMICEHRARCVIIDPLSALAKEGNERTSFGVVERLTRWGKLEGLTLFCTSLLESNAPESESTPLQISTIADTWIHLSYRVQAGERNRALTIIKSRGTAHSNQVRELILSDAGISLADVYTAGGEVLMGTLRWEKEELNRAEERRRAEDTEQRIKHLDAEERELTARLKALEKEIAAKRAERGVVSAREKDRRELAAVSRTGTRRLRHAEVENAKS